MQDIKPDTSKYPKLTDKLRAIALIFDSDGSFQVKGGNPNGMWNENHIFMDLSHMCEQVLSGGEIRIKPKPRELWAVVLPDETLYDEGNGPKTYDEAPRLAPGHRAVRFVEQP